MPIAEYWSEELVAEWLDLEGFVVRVKPPIVEPRGRGGTLAPDVVGGRVGANGEIEIRHCEVAGWPIRSAEDVARDYKKKFQPAVKEKVRSEFEMLFGLPVGHSHTYEPWVIALHLTPGNKAALASALPGVKLYILDEFICREVFPTIDRWKRAHRTPRTPPNSIFPLPPQNYRNLCLLYYLRSKKLLQCPQNSQAKEP